MTGDPRRLNSYHCRDSYCYSLTNFRVNLCLIHNCPRYPPQPPSNSQGKGSQQKPKEQ